MNICKVFTYEDTEIMQLDLYHLIAITPYPRVIITLGLPCSEGIGKSFRLHSDSGEQTNVIMSLS